jgi:hypothetical protein
MYQNRPMYRYTDDSRMRAKAGLGHGETGGTFKPLMGHDSYR